MGDHSELESVAVPVEINTKTEKTIRATDGERNTLICIENPSCAMGNILGATRGVAARN